MIIDETKADQEIKTFYQFLGTNRLAKWDILFFFLRKPYARYDLNDVQELLPVNKFNIWSNLNKFIEQGYLRIVVSHQRARQIWIPSNKYAEVRKVFFDYLDNRVKSWRFTASRRKEFEEYGHLFKDIKEIKPNILYKERMNKMKELLNKSPGDVTLKYIIERIKEER